MFPNESICILESEYSGQEIQEVGTGYGIGIATIIGIIAAIGLVIRGIFIYYIQYEAPGDRPINQMILSGQVGSYLTSAFNFWIIFHQYSSSRALAEQNMFPPKHTLNFGKRNDEDVEDDEGM